MKTTNARVTRATNGIAMSSNKIARAFGGNSNIHTFSEPITDIASMKRPASAVALALSENRSEERNYAPFDHIDFRYGGPMLNTPATRMYWKQDTRNSDVFS